MSDPAESINHSSQDTGNSRPARRSVRLLLSYDGSGFHGWQVQPGLLTVQGCLTEALAQVTGERVLLYGSGRTDAGVHALGQVAHFQLSGRLPVENLQRALNAVLPATVRVLRAEDVPAGFHARGSARSKLYRYRLYRAPVCSPFLARYVYHFPYPLHLELMRQAAAAFLGEHDFKSFAAASEPDRRTRLRQGGEEERSTVRTIFRSEWLTTPEEWIYEVSGSGFLHHMVRNLVGFMIDVGRGQRHPREVPLVLAARDRRRAGRTAPARGLCLVSVDYGEEA